MNSAAVAACLSGRRVLVVEDEYLLALDLRQTIERLGGQVIGPVANVSDALRLIAAGLGCDGAVLDVNLGGDEVYPVAHALRQSGIPFVFATGYDESSIPNEYRSIPRYVKPVDIENVASALFSAG